MNSEYVEKFSLSSLCQTNQYLLWSLLLSTTEHGKQNKASTEIVRIQCSFVVLCSFLNAVVFGRHTDWCNQMFVFNDLEYLWNDFVVEFGLFCLIPSQKQRFVKFRFRCDASRDALWQIIFTVVHLPWMWFGRYRIRGNGRTLDSFESNNKIRWKASILARVHLSKTIGINHWRWHAFKHTISSVHDKQI